MLDTVSVPERIVDGVALLDAELPGWYNKPLLTGLDMDDTLECILGKLYGSYNSFVVDHQQYSGWARLGFVALAEESPTKLGKVWKDYIRLRRASER